MLGLGCVQVANHTGLVSNSLKARSLRLPMLEHDLDSALLGEDLPRIPSMCIVGERAKPNKLEGASCIHKSLVKKGRNEATNSSRELTTI